MKNNWKKVKLEDISKMKYGYGASAKEKKVGPKFLRITDIVPDTIDWKKVPFCEIDKKNHKKYKLEKGDIVVARTGATAGYAKLIRKNTSAVFASYLIKIKLKTDIYEGFVGRLLESNIFKSFIDKNKGGSAQPHANAPVLKKFEFFLPPMGTQKKIASILSAYDELIKNNNERIKILEQMARSIYKEWFVNFKFPGHENVKMVDSELGKIPEGWKIEKIHNIAKIKYGNNLPMKNMKKNGKYLVYGSSKIVGKYDKYNCENPTVITGCRGTCGNVKITKPRSFVTNNSFIFDVEEELKLFFYHQLKYKGFANYIGGTAQPQITLKGLSGYNMLLSPSKLIRKFKKIDSIFFTQIRILEDKNNFLKKTRDILLPKLISGEIDVSDLDIEVKE